MTVSVVQSGDYELFIDTGRVETAFLLDSSILNGTDVLNGVLEFAKVGFGTLNVNIRRGRQDVGDQFSAGTMTFTLNDTLAAGVFNPFDTVSPFYDTALDQPGLAPMREVRFVRYDDLNNEQDLFVGYIVNYDYTFTLGGINTVTVYCADQFYLLAQTVLDELTVTAQLPGARIATVLALPEVGYTDPVDLAAGTVDLGSTAEYVVPAGTNVLAYLSQINSTAEFGRLFMSRDGVLTFQNRVGNTLAGAVVDFSDDGTETPYDTIGITFEADQVVNRAVVTALDDKTATDTDAASIAEYFTQTTSITNSLLTVQGQIDDAAAYLLNGQPEARYTDVGTYFAALSTAQRDAVAIVDIGDTITIAKTFPAGSGTATLTQELSIEGVEHSLDFGSGHRVKFFTAQTDIVQLLLLAGFTTTQTRTNLVRNPSYEVNTTGWTVVQLGTTITRITTDARFGTACVQVTKSVQNGRISLVSTAGQRIAVTAGVAYRISAFVKVSTGQPSCSLRIRTSEFRADGVQNPAQVSAAVVVTDADDWVRLSFVDTPTAGANPTVTMVMGVEETTSNTRTYLVDGVLFEETSELRPYFDGNEVEPYPGFTLIEGPAFTGVANLSTSIATFGLNSSFTDTDSELDSDNVLGA